MTRSDRTLPDASAGPRDRTTGRATPWLLVGLAVLAATGGAGSSTSSDLAGQASRQLVGRLDARPGMSLDLQVPEAHVRVHGESRADIRIEADADGWPDVSTALRVEVEEANDGEVVLVRSRGEPAGGALRLRVAVPAGLHVRVDVRRGRVELEGLRGTTGARVDEGTIVAADVSGVVRLETSSGDLHLERTSMATDSILRLRTLKGGIFITLGERPADARILLLALRGGVESTIPLEARGRVREAVFGRGRALLSADAVEGDIRLSVP